MNAAALRALAPTLNIMPSPADTTASDDLESALAQRFGARHAIAVSSGTAALYTALAAADIGHGDEVLLPAATVAMTVAAVVSTGAHPIFVDSPPGQLGMDPADARAKISPRTRALLPVHLFGHLGLLDELVVLATEHQLLVVEDACQAQGSQLGARHAGTPGTIGCFSLKDGKILACGEGGYLLTDDTALAATAAAFRTHHLAPAPGIPAGTRLGFNFRLAQPLAALAHHHLGKFTAALARRRSQHDRLHDRLADAVGLTAIPAPEGTNRYSPLWRMDLPDPRGFAAHLARHGIVNSTGTFGLKAAPEQPWCADLAPDACPNATATIDRLLAVTVTAAHSDTDLDTIADMIIWEARAWT